MNYPVKILEKEQLTHDVIRLELAKPAGFEFTAGQAIELTIDEPGFRGDWAPFTLTGLNNQANLELIIKIYADHHGMTKRISEKQTGDELLISGAWDSFPLRGPGVFIAGGTGITPFIAILRQLLADGSIGNSQLFFSNKTHADIFLEAELRSILGARFVNVLTRENRYPYPSGRIDSSFLQTNIFDFDLPFYVCGPGNFVEQVQDALVEIGAKNMIPEIT